LLHSAQAAATWLRNSAVRAERAAAVPAARAAWQLSAAALASAARPPASGEVVGGSVPEDQIDDACARAARHDLPHYPESGFRLVSKGQWPDELVIFVREDRFDHGLPIGVDIGRDRGSETAVRKLQSPGRSATRLQPDHAKAVLLDQLHRIEPQFCRRLCRRHPRGRIQEFAAGAYVHEPGAAG